MKYNYIYSFKENSSDKSFLNLKNYLVTLVMFLSVLMYGNPPIFTKNYVNINATGNNDGTSWEDAYTDLQVAIDNSSQGAEIWVAAGTYLPTSSPDDSTDNDRNKSFHLNTDMKIYGGFAGTETSLEDRDLDTNITILSGDLGVVGDIEDNAYHVMITANLTTSTVIDGFTITEGNTSRDDNHSDVSYDGENFNDERGGGQYNISSSPTLVNVIFIKNYGYSGVGQCNSSSSSPVLTNVTFSNNSADRFGGGQYNVTSSSPILTNVTFNNNSALYGGGQSNSNSSITLTNVIFSGNSAEYRGGGQYNSSSRSSASSILTNVVFSGNSSEEDGGGQYNSFDSSVLTNVTFVANSAENNGGGQYTTSDSSQILYNTVFYKNTDDGEVNDVHIAQNLVNKVNDIVKIGATNIVSSLSTNNASDGNNAPGVTVTLTADPFVDSNNPAGADGVFGTSDDGLIPNPTAPSPLVDAGDTTQNTETLDFAGNTRVYNTTIDIGAYELQDVITSSTLSNHAFNNIPDLVLSIENNTVVSNLTSVSLTIYGLTGQQVANQNLQGVYIIKAIDTNGNVEVQKVIVE